MRSVRLSAISPLIQRPSVRSGHAAKFQTPSATFHRRKTHRTFAKPRLSAFRRQETPYKTDIGG